MDGGRGKGGMLALLSVHAFREYWRLDRKPPVTAGLLAANTLIYLRPWFLQPILPTINQVWFNPYLILKQVSLTCQVNNMTPYVYLDPNWYIFGRSSLIDDKLEDREIHNATPPPSDQDAGRGPSLKDITY